MSEQRLDAHLEQWEQRPEEMIEIEKGYLEWLEEHVAQLKAELAEEIESRDGWHDAWKKSETENERLKLQRMIDTEALRDAKVDIESAIYNEDGLDGIVGAHTLAKVEAALGGV